MGNNFNPRAPCGARHGCASDRPTEKISTHAPLAGRDIEGFIDSDGSVIFQPTRPLRGATIAANMDLFRKEISTHAPLAGRDPYSLSALSQRRLFQPTRPLRGATRNRPPLTVWRFDFNPRAPCGARQQKCTNHYAHFCDNRQISDAFAQNAACQGILLLFDAGKPCGFWVRTAQVISAHLCFAL